MGIGTNAFKREIGKNTGKWISNVVFGDSHSTPYRRVGSNRENREKLFTVNREFQKRNKDTNSLWLNLNERIV